MKTAIIADVLHSIRDTYRSVCRLTETANPGSDPRTCLDFIKKREKLLIEISSKQAILEKQSKSWHDICYKNSELNAILKEIGTYIATIAALDTVMQQRLSNKIHTLKDELYHFNNSSKVALSYARAQ